MAIGEYANKQERNDYNISSSETAQSNFEQVAARLETQLAARDSDVKKAMAEYQADGVSDEYAAMEQQWNQAGSDVKSIIKAIRQSLGGNDDHARRALSMARKAIPLAS